MFEVGYSKVKSYRRCPKSYEYKYVRNLQRKKPAAPLIRGTMLHEMLDARAKRSMKKPSSTPASIFANYEKQFGTLFREERETYGENFLEDIRRVWDGYETAYFDDDWVFESSEEQVETELAKGIVFKGHLDKRIIWKDRRWIVDHKTHKTIPSEENRFNDYQILLYLWVYNLQHPKEKAEGIVWDYLRTKPPRIPEQLKNGGLSQRADMDTDYATYARELRRLKLDPKPYTAFLESLKKRSQTKFLLRVPLPAPSKEMTESVVKDFRQTAQIMNGLRVYPRTMTRDCSWCEYYRLCSAELRGLDAKYIEKTEFQEKAIADETSEEE